MRGGAILAATMPLGAAVFDPATLALSGWWRASYTGSPWAANASAGVSATTGALVTAGSDPTTGTAQNSLTPAAFASASSQYLTNTATADTLFNGTAGTIVALFYGVSAVAPTGNKYDDAAIYVDAGIANTALTYTTSGFGAVSADGAIQSVYVAAATGSYHLAMMRWNGSVLGLTVDSAAESTTPAGTMTLGAGTVSVGQGYLGGSYIEGRILELMTSAADLSASYSDIKSYVNSRYALSL